MLPSSQELRAFSAAVRQKKDWYNKILEQNCRLATKWAIEAKLLPENESGWSKPSARAVLAHLEELKGEARRIRFEDHLVNPVSRKLEPREVDFDRIASDVRREINFMSNSEYALRQPKLSENVGVFVSNGLVPVSLQKELIRELDQLSELGFPDYHPGSSRKVQDLIHPSLRKNLINQYPYPPLSAQTCADPFVSGVTETSSDVPKQEDEFKTKMEVKGEHVRTINFSSKFAWIPSVIMVSPDEKDARIESYVNGLGPRANFPTLYRLLELTFLLALPHLKRTLDAEWEWEESDAVQRWNDRAHLRERVIKEKVWNDFLAKQKRQKDIAQEEVEREEARKVAQVNQDRNNPRLFEDDPANPAVQTVSTPSAGDPRLPQIDPLLLGILPSETPSSQLPEGTKYKVIIKAANYLLRPGETYEGTWHLEGMPHERILASAIYYYDTDPSIADSGLSLRRQRLLGIDFPDPEMHIDRFAVTIQRPVTTGSDFFGKKKRSRYSDDDDYDEEDEYLPSESTGKTDVRTEEIEEMDYPSDTEDDVIHGSSDSQFKDVIPLGTVPTHVEEGFNNTGRIISFPNWVQHKVEGVKNLGAVVPGVDQPHAKRKIVCFFLVDSEEETDCDFPVFEYTDLPDFGVFTTSDIPNQARLCNIPTLRFLLGVGCRRLTGKDLPRELSEMILHSTGFGFSREMAEEYRRGLMSERSAGNLKLSEVGGYGLCEH